MAGRWGDQISERALDHAILQVQRDLAVAQVTDPVEALRFTFKAGATFVTTCSIHTEPNGDDGGRPHSMVAVAALMDAMAPENLARLLVAMLLPAGDSDDWDSETIEHVLTPAAEALRRAEIPWIGDATPESLAYWRAIGREFGNDYPED